MSWYCSFAVAFAVAISSHCLPRAAGDDLNDAADAAFRLLRTDTAAAALAARKVRNDYPSLSDALLIRMLWVEGAGLSHSGQHREAIAVLTEASERARAAGDLSHLRRSLRFLAVSWYETGEYQKGRDAAVEAIAITKQLNDDTTYVVRLLNEQAVNEIALGNYAEAVRCYERGLPIVQQHGDVRTEMVVRNNLAALLAEIGWREDAIPQYEVVLGHAQLSGNQFLEAQVSSELGALLVTQGYPERGEQLLLQAMEIAELWQLREPLAIAHGNLGDFYAASSSPEEAGRHFEAAAKIWEELENPARLADSTLRLAALRQASAEDAMSAKELLDRARELELHDDFVGALNQYGLAVQAYRAEGQWKQVAEIQEKLLKLQAIRSSREYNESVAELTSSLNEIEQQRHIIELQSEAALNEFEAAMAVRENRRLFTVVIVLLGMLAIVAVSLRARGAALKASQQAHAALEKQRQLQRAADHLLAQQQRTECLELLAAGIAHDFNNSLTAIAAMAELGVMSDDNAGKDEMLSQITASTRHAAALTSQLVQFLGEASPEEKRCDLGSVISSIRGLLGTIVRGRAELRIELPDDELPTRIASAHVQQVVVNLVTNAAEAAGPAGCIRLEVESRQCDSETLRRLTSPGSASAGKFRRIQVTDNGPGIPAEIRSRILDPYYSTKRAGRGMGLASVQGIVKAAGGAIDIGEAAEGGARITLFLPAAEDSEAALPSADASPESEHDAGPQPVAAGAETTTTACSVLLVDDESQVVSLMTQILNRAGFEVLTADNAVDAMTLVREQHQRLHCVVTDFAMAGKDGVWLAEHVRAINPRLPVILCSGFADHDHASHPHVAMFLQKPYTGRELVQSVRRVLRSS